MTTKTPRRGGDRIAGTLIDGEYTRTQLADEVGMPFGTLRRWLREGIYVPHESGHDKVVGATQFHVFTGTDVEAVRTLCRERGLKLKRRRNRT